MQALPDYYCFTNQNMKSNLIIIFLLLTIIACSDNKGDVKTDTAKKEFDLAIRAKDQQRAVFLADSLERAGDISAVCADFMRGKAYDFTYQKRLSELYYRKSYDALKNKPTQDWDTYAEAGYRLSASEPSISERMLKTADKR